MKPRDCSSATAETRSWAYPVRIRARAHELSHALSGAPYMSLEFEQQLTEELGELTEQGALAGDVEVPAYHRVRSGLVRDVSEHGELGAVQRIKPVRFGPVTVMVGHRMGVDHPQRRAG